MKKHCVVAHLKTLTEPYVDGVLRKKATEGVELRYRSLAADLLESHIPVLTKALGDNPALTFACNCIRRAKEWQRRLLTDGNVMFKLHFDYLRADKKAMHPLTVKYITNSGEAGKITFPNVQFVNYMFNIEKQGGYQMSWQDATDYINEIHMRHEWDTFLYLNKHILDFEYMGMLESSIDSLLPE